LDLFLSFDHDNRIAYDLAQITETLTLQELRSHFDHYVFNSSSRRRISSRVFGNKHSMVGVDQNVHLNDRGETSSEKRSNLVLIAERAKFVNQMPLFPIEFSPQFSTGDE